MKIKMCIVVLLLCQSLLLAFPGGLTVGAHFGMRHNNQKDKYIDGANIQILYPISKLNRIDAIVSFGTDQWRERQRPASLYGFEYTYKTTTILGGIRFYLLDKKSKVIPYAFLLYGIYNSKIDDKWTSYSLVNGADRVDNVNRRSFTEKGTNTCIGFGYTFSIFKALYYDMSISHNTALYTHLLMGLNFQF